MKHLKLSLIFCFLALSNICSAGVVYSINSETLNVKVKGLYHSDSEIVVGNRYDFEIGDAVEKEGIVKEHIDVGKFIVEFEDLEGIVIGQDFFLKQRRKNEEDPPPQEKEEPEDPNLSEDHFYSSQNNMYKLSLDGFGAYLDDELSNGSDYRALKLNYYGLQARQKTGFVVMISSLIGGGLFLLDGYYTDEQEAELTDAEKRQASAKSLLGVIIMLVGWGVGEAITPDKKDILKLVYKNNELNENRRIIFPREKQKSGLSFTTSLSMLKEPLFGLKLAF